MSSVGQAKQVILDQERAKADMKLAKLELRKERQKEKEVANIKKIKEMHIVLFIFTMLGIVPISIVGSLILTLLATFLVGPSLGGILGAGFCSLFCLFSIYALIRARFFVA
jgi:maltodextrin utilization protein YvdJ